MPSKKDVGTITLYTHFFMVTTTDARVALACQRVLDKWSEKKWINQRTEDGQNKKVLVIEKVYGTVYDHGVTHQFHKGQFNDFKKYLAEQELLPDDLEIQVQESYTPSTVSYKLQDHRVLRDYQENAKAFAIAPVDKGDHFSKLIAMPTGTGKALCNDTLIITPFGNKRLGDICVGDEVLAPDGTWTTVFGVYPQGVRKAHRIHFQDGRQAVCDEEHLWDVKVPQEGTYSLSYTFTTKEIKEKIKTQVLSIDLYEPLNFVQDADAYMDKLLLTQMRLHKRCEVKSDGLYYTPTNAQDSDDTCELLWSMGAVVETIINDDTSTCLKINHPRISSLLSESERSVELEDLNEATISLGLGIRSIEEAGACEMTCIEVEHASSLFVLADYIVTHNTVTSCGIAAEQKKRWMVGVLPKYKEKWAKDITDNLDLKPKEVMIVDTTAGLRGLIDLCKTQGAKKLQPVIVITLTTLRSFIESYHEDRKACVEDYGCAPWEMWRILDIGMFSVDEAHEHIYSVFLATLHMHGPQIVCMSGTMISEDPFQESVQNMIFPMIKRYLDVKMERYIDVEFLRYAVVRELRHKVKYQAFGRKDYSHVELEKSFMRNSALLKGFLRMVGDIVDFGYIAVRQKNDKALVYVATVEMANHVLKYLTERFPQAKINRYVGTEKDDYNDLLSSDVTVSTIQSAGTAVDVPGLISVVCTTMINSGKSNLQVLGRLRKLDGKKVTMFMPYCTHIEKHYKYTCYRHELFKNITKSIRTFNYVKELGSY